MCKSHAYTKNNCLFISTSILPGSLWALPGCFPQAIVNFVSAGSVTAFEDSESNLQGSDSDVQGRDSDVIPTTQSMDIDEGSTSSSMTSPLSISTCRMADRIESVSGKISSNRGLVVEAGLVGGMELVGDEDFIEKIE